MKTPRDYQTQAVDCIRREFETVQSTLCVSPTGSGKSFIAAELIRQLIKPNGAINEDFGNVLFLAHREELLTQAKRTIEAHVGVECEIEMGESHASEIFPAPVLLASVQSMISGRGEARRMHKFSPYNYGLVVCDEGHHYTSPMFRAVVDYFKTNTDLKILGITATPNRTDEEALAQIFETCAFEYPLLQAIKDGWLVYPKQQLIDIQGLDFSHIRTTAGDLNAGDLAQVMEAERNLYGICDATMRELGQRKAIMFTVTVKQAQMATEIFNRYRQGVAVMAHGGTPKDIRRRIWRDFNEGRHQLFVNVDLVGEGADVPDADLLVDGAPTKSAMRYEQRLGRILRPLPDTVDNLNSSNERIRAIADSRKPFSTVIDFTGNAGRHKLIHAVDILGGKISEKARELVERELRKTGQAARVDELVIEAERKERADEERAERARKARITGTATYSIRHVDPFDAWDVFRPADRAWDRGKQLSPKQRALLAKQSIDPDRLSYAEGKAALNAMFARWSNGLCSLKQASLLKRYGYQSNVTREEASAIISQLAANNWKKA